MTTPLFSSDNPETELLRLRTLIIAWRDMTPDQMRLYGGEMTTQEIRTVQAVLNMIVPRQSGEVRSTGLASRILAHASRKAETILARAQMLSNTPPEVLEKAVEVLESEEAAASWLTSSGIIPLEGHAPVELVGTPEGRERVLSVLNSLEYGLGA